MAKTLYQAANDEIRECINDYLILIDETNNLSNITINSLNTERKITILLSGKSIQNTNYKPKEAIDEWNRRKAIPFDIENSITTSVYKNIRKLGSELFDILEKDTKKFTNFDPDYIHNNPFLLPLFQHLSGVFSKSKLKSKIGTASDNSIPKPASIRLSELLNDTVEPKNINKGEILQRLEATLEGIVRDLVGRVLLESIVASALKKIDIPFMRENEYSFLKGVVYNFRADFIIPNELSPKAFIEVRKSSSRHASLYAKDKMFSAINWKGNNKELLAVLVVDGEWTKETLTVMANVFDYVVPIGNVIELANTISAYLKGDQSKLKWLIDFKISKK
jgi:hypothetical protein